MELGPIFRALINHRSRFWLITVEIALTLAIVVNCVNMIFEERARMLRPTGMDVDRAIVVLSEPWSEVYRDDDFVRAAFREDLRVLRAVPGVEAAAGTSAIPLSGGGSATGRRPVGSEENSQTLPYFLVTDGFLETLGLKLVAGRGFEPADFPESLPDPMATANAEEDDAPETHNVLVTRATADRMFPDGDALGASIENSTGRNVETIVGIVERMHGSWPLSSVAEEVMLLPGEPADSRRTQYLVRAEPGRFDEVFRAVESALIAAEDGRIVRVESLANIKAETYLEVTAVTQLLGGLSVLLVAVTVFGIVGVTSFSVTQRRREIGTRRALGATRLAILRYFLVENWVMTAVGLGFGLLLAYGLNWLLAHYTDVARLDLRFVIGGMILLWLSGQASALIPALRGMGVAPVVATRNVY